MPQLKQFLELFACMFIYTVCVCMCWKCVCVCTCVCVRVCVCVCICTCMCVFVFLAWQTTQCNFPLPISSWTHGCHQLCCSKAEVTWYVSPTFPSHSHNHKHTHTCTHQIKKCWGLYVTYYYCLSVGVYATQYFEIWLSIRDNKQEGIKGIISCFTILNECLFCWLCTLNYNKCNSITVNIVYTLILDLRMRIFISRLQSSR